MADAGSGPTLDYGALTGAERGLDAAAGELDAVGNQAPEGDYGDAGALVALAFAAHAETAAKLITEARMLGYAIELATADMRGTDAQQAIDIVRLGSR